MPTNLVSTISRFLTPDIVTRIALSLGLDRGSVEQAIAAGVPSILAGLAGLASTPDGAQRLSNVVAQQAPTVLDDAKEAFGSSDQNSFADRGTSILSTLLGGSTVKSLSAAVGDYAGIRGGAGKALLGLLAPVVLGALGQQQRASGLDAHGLANMLHGQKDAIANALPTGFAQQLSGTGILDSIGEGWRGTTAAAAAAASRVGSAPGTAYGSYAVSPSSSSGASTWPIWLIAIAAVGGLLWYLLSDQQPDQMAQTPTPTEEGRAVSTPQVSASELSQQLSASISGLRTTLQGVTDPATAQAALPKLKATADNLDKLTEMASNLPPAAKQTVTNQVSAMMPTINQQIQRLLSDPAVAQVARPVIETVRTKLNALAGA